MRATWNLAEPQVSAIPSDGVSEIFWRMDVRIAVFDHGGRLAYANPAFASHAATEFLDDRGFLRSGTLERRRQELATKSGGGPNPWEAPEPLPSDATLFPLGVAPGWVALTVLPPRAIPGRPPELPSLELLVHELRNPLLAAGASLATLMDEGTAEENPRLEAAIARHARSLDRLAGLIQGLSDLNRADTLEERRLSWGQVDLAREVRAVGELYADLSGPLGRDLLLTVDSPVPTIQGDPEMLQRAIGNLVDNALKYSPAESPVSLRLRQRGSLLVVEVRDQGPGVPRRHRDAIFADFVRMPVPGRDEVTGYGLGLAVARRVARAHGATLSLECLPSQGSTFRLSFLPASGPA